MGLLVDHVTRKKNILEAVRITDDDERKYGILKDNICPFFKEGEYSPCIKCSVENYDLDECTEYFLDRVDHFKIDQWEAKFDLPITRAREKKKLEDISEVGMTCNSCYMSEKCPMYEKHAACGIDFGDIPAGNVQKLDMLIEMQTVRIKRASTFEVVDGGVPDTNLSVEMDRLTNMIAMKDNFGRDKLSISVEASGNGASAGGSILEKLFGGGAAKPVETTEDVVHKEVSKVLEIEEAKVEFMPDNAVDSYSPEKKRKMPPPPKRKVAE